MTPERVIKPAFTVIGKEGAATDGPGFIQRLWDDANAHFGEVAFLAKVDENGQLAGIWGAMSDMDRQFAPWTDGFTCGLYLAGVECVDSAEPPAGWTKWIIPGYEYLRAPSTDDLFPRMLQYLADNGFTLVGAVHDHTDLATGTSYMYFPIRRL